MNTNPYYDGQGGGGFNNGPYGDGASQGSQGGSKSKGGNSTLRPVTIKQILDAELPHPDSDFSIEGVDVGSVSIIAVVRNIASTATNVSYRLEDGTGAVDARVWLDTSEDGTGKTDGIEQDMYVSVMGQLKSFNNKRHVSAQNIRPVTDMNEVFYHLLESLYVTLTYRNPGAVGGAKADHGGVGQSDYAMGGMGGGGGQEQWSEYPETHRRIMQYVTESSEGDGAHVASIARAIGGDGIQIMDAIEYLIGEGQLYTTIDDMHVKVV